ncbi:MAG: flagellar biosynthesis anti-sigma factor FlgM [Pseudomonadota bacterium]
MNDMKPTDIGLNNVRLDQVANNRPQNGQNAPISGQGAGQDKVTLTSSAGRIQDAVNGVRSAPDIDAAKVDAIKTSIENGSFEIDVDRIAARLIEANQDLK